MEGEVRVAGGAGGPPGKCGQGGMGDWLTHRGRVASLRGLRGAKMKSENSSKAGIVAGRVGPEQTAPKREFD